MANKIILALVFFEIRRKRKLYL